MANVEVPESHRSLLDIPCASLTTIGDDGIPQSTIVYFLFEDGRFRTSLEDSRLKVRNLRRRPECSALLSDDPYWFLDIRGRATIETDHDYAFARRLMAKYGGTPEDLGMIGQKRLVITIEPVNVYAADVRAHVAE